METETLEATWLTGYTLSDLRSGMRYIWHEGGTRSSKTYSIVIALVCFVLETSCRATIVRMSNPVIKNTVLLDLIEVTERMGIYSEERHNKTEQYMTLPGGGRIEYFGVDKEQKVRGAKRDVLHMNEANEISDAKRRQLWMRTTQSIVLDHNPTVDDDHWIVQRLEPRVDRGEAVHYHSTYRDNTFLTEATIREIEAMQRDDPYGWKVFGLGERGSNPAAVFEDVTLGAFDSQKNTVYGVDFGFQNPFVVAEWGWRDANPPAVPQATLYCRPLIYGTKLTTGDVIESLEEQGASKDKEMYCDSAEPDRILELQRAGFDAKPAHKAPGVREASYDWMKRHRIVVDYRADAGEAVKNELKRTRHKTKPGSTDEYTDQVVDDDDHVADSGRYGAFTRWGKVQKRRPKKKHTRLSNYLG